MTETISEKDLCISCGADVREGTHYCYNCGKPVRAPIEDNVRDADIDAAYETSVPTASDPNRVRAAADKRKQSRLAKLQASEYEWKAPGETLNRIYILFCLLVFVLSAAVVGLALWFR